MKTHPFSHFFLSLFVLLDFAAMAAYEALGFSLSFPFLQKKVGSDKRKKKRKNKKHGSLRILPQLS
ncbi:hypothetical protein ES288_D13G249000v1 [Gossypium darwinii]|uniref:Uncharacterized protein n=1 Tax=Gossypium darwinii TaxID=34276 RepID=A0A5D2A421_GOSDA|nr:hypothetical protein ES288_D13G249000v1 [Gossypium darwinii]